MFDVWKNVLAELEQMIPSSSFNAWVADSKLLGIEDGVALVGTNNLFKVKHLKDRYHSQIEGALRKNGVEFEKIKYDLIKTGGTQVKSTKKIPSRELIEKPTLERKSPQNKTSDSRWDSKSGTGLNPRYSLDNFVIGSNNDLAVSVAKGVIDRPGDKFNPFFLYGGPGLGKTHLVHAIGNALLRKDSRLKILYTEMNHFYSDFINAVKNNKMEDFARKFRKLDVLIIDDFQMIVGKERSQEEFFNIFNDMYQLNKQIIITSDRLPSQIETVDERLASRLTWGGAIDLQMPNFEDRCAILKMMAEVKGAEIEDEAVEYIAENVKTNIRDLEGRLMRMLAMAELKDTTPLELLKDGYIDTTPNARTRAVAPKQVVEKVAKYYDLTAKELCSKSRVSVIKTARQVAMFLLSEELNMSTTKIAYEVGVKDHTTVMHGVKKIKTDMEKSFALREEVGAIREKIYG